MVRASASQSVDLGFIPLVESYQKTLKNGIYSFPAWRSAFMGSYGEQAGKFTCCVLAARHLTGCPRLYVEDRWPINLEKGSSQASDRLPVQSIAITHLSFMTVVITSIFLRDCIIFSYVCFLASDRHTKFPLKHLSFMTPTTTFIFLQDCIVIRLNPLPTY